MKKFFAIICAAVLLMSGCGVSTGGRTDFLMGTVITLKATDSDSQTALEKIYIDSRRF